MYICTHTALGAVCKDSHFSKICPRTSELPSHAIYGSVISQLWSKTQKQTVWGKNKKLALWRQGYLLINYCLPSAEVQCIYCVRWDQPRRITHFEEN